MRFDQSIVTVKQSSVVSQIVSSPVVLLQLVLLDLVKVVCMVLVKVSYASVDGRSDDQTQPTFEMTPGFKPFTQFMM